MIFCSFGDLLARPVRTSVVRAEFVAQPMGEKDDFHADRAAGAVNEFHAGEQAVEAGFNLKS